MKNVIIGAGPAGITATYQLSKQPEMEVELVEKADFIGGISATLDFDGSKVDLGPHRFYTKSDRVQEFWESILPLQGKPAIDDIELGHNLPFSEKSNAPDPEQTDDVFLKRPRLTRIYHRKKFFDYPVKLSWNTIKGLGFFNMIKIGFTYSWTLVFKKKETNLENFFINRFGRHLYKTFFKDYTEKLWGIKCSEISAEWGAQRVKGISISKILKEIVGKIFYRGKFQTKETSLIEFFYYPKFGSGQMYEKMAKIASENNAHISLSTNVEKIIMEEGKISSIIVNTNGNLREICGDNFISSIPIKELIAKMDGNVPENVKQVANGLMYRNVRLGGFLLKKLKMKNTTNIKTYNDIVPDVWIYIQEKNILAGRLEIMNNFSPYMIKDNKNQVCITVEYFCSDTDDLWTMPDDVFCRLVLSELVQMGFVDEKDVISQKSFKVEKGYPVYFGTYKDFDTVKEYINSIPNLYPIGRNGMHKYNNMDHSILTALETVDCIIGKTPSKESIWKVNTEQSYHEEK